MIIIDKRIRMLFSIPIQGVYSPKPGQAETSSEKHSLGKHVLAHCEFSKRVFERKRERPANKTDIVKQQAEKESSRSKGGVFRTGRSSKGSDDNVVQYERGTDSSRSAQVV